MRPSVDLVFRESQPFTQFTYCKKPMILVQSLAVIFFLLAVHHCFSVGFIPEAGRFCFSLRSSHRPSQMVKYSLQGSTSSPIRMGDGTSHVSWFSIFILINAPRHLKQTRLIRFLPHFLLGRGCAGALLLRVLLFSSGNSWDRVSRKRRETGHLWSDTDNR